MEILLESFEEHEGPVRGIGKLKNTYKKIFTLPRQNIYYFTRINT